MNPWEAFARTLATNGAPEQGPRSAYEQAALAGMAGQAQPPQVAGSEIPGQVWPNPTGPLTGPVSTGINVDHLTNLAKGVAGTAGIINPTDKTENDYSAGVINALREAALNTDIGNLEKGKFSGVHYKNYPNVSRNGQEFAVNDLVTNPAAREKAGLGGHLNMGVAALNDPTLSAATSLGSGSLFVRDGKVYFSDKYDFAKKSANKAGDGYSEVRNGLANLVGEGGDFASVVELGSAKDIYKRDLPDTENLPPHIARRFEQQEAEGRDPNAPTSQYQDLINAAPTMQKALRDSPVIEVGGNPPTTMTQDLINAAPTMQRALNDSPVIEVGGNKGTGADVTQGMVAGDNTYTIRKGDTLSQLAKRLGTTVRALQNLNGIENADKIRAGAKLKY